MPHRFQIAEPRAARHAGFPLNWPWRRRAANEFSLHRIFFRCDPGPEAEHDIRSAKRLFNRKPPATAVQVSVRLRTFQNEDVLALEADRHRLAALRRRGARIVEGVEMDRALLEAQANAHD